MSLTARPLLPVTGRSVELELTPDPPFRLEEGKEYTIRCTPLSGFRRYSAGREVDTSDFAGFDWARPAVASNGRLRLDMCFPQEDEYWLRVSDGEREIGCPRVYALEPDLHACYPLKGDLHNHTYLSDGRESPAYVIAMLRKKGADFASITDHGWYQPSLEALEYWKELGTDFLVLPGEEVHAPDCRVHILSVGGRFSVNSWGYDGASDYREKLEQEKSKLPANLDEDDRTRIAASQAVFDKAREAGALSLFCHPFWETADGFDIHEDVTRYLLDHRRFDALEVIGGYWPHEYRDNLFQTAYYYQYCMGAGSLLPLMGCSDCHSTDSGLFTGLFYSIVFAEDNTFEAIAGAVRAGRSVAVKALPGQMPEAFGDFRYVRLCAFLFGRVFPGHDRICEEEGEWMRQAVFGRQESFDQLKEPSRRILDYYDNLK